MTTTLPPAQPHSPASIAAAEAIAAKAWTLRAQVYGHLRECGWMGATDEEIQLALGMDPSTQRPRRVELVRQGLVRDSGAKRETRSGREAGVWVVNNLGVTDSKLPESRLAEIG
jgi:hypothetical protein